MRLFDIENPVFSGIIKVVDCIYLSAIWLVFSLPVVTIGASSAAMYVTAYKYLRKDEGHLWSTFWTAFRENLRRSTLLWLIALVIQGVLVVDALVFRGMEIRGEPLGKLYWFLLVLCCIAMTWVAYMTAYSARFNGSVKDVLKFSFFLLAAHPLRALGVTATILAMLALIIIGPGLILILPTVGCLVCSLIIEKVFLLHMSEEDVKRTIGKEDKT